MVNKHEHEEEFNEVTEITNEPAAPEDAELADEEEYAAGKLKKLRAELKEAQEEARTLREDLQRERADFLNAKRRLEEDRQVDRQRITERHLEKLLPLCDSFRLAMMDKAAWEAIDPNWRKGIEGIKQQLDSLLSEYHVTPINPQNEPFDPLRHEALKNEAVETAEEHHKVVQVLQLGYEMKQGERTVVIRPARVVVGEFSKEQ